MLRRDAIALLLAAPAMASKSLRRLVDSTHGAALVVDLQTRRPIAVEGAGLAAGFLAPPGSTLKPLTLTALIESGKLAVDESYPCPGNLSIRGRSLACSHPPIGSAMRIHTALAYSCNCFVAHFSERFAAAELAGALGRFGLSSPTGWFPETEVAGEAARVEQGPATGLQALGEDHVLVTCAELALAYCRLARSLTRPGMAPVLQGLEDAVDFGTAQRARTTGSRVAGKTGSVRTAGGVPIAWFAGFAPSRSPKVVVTVMQQGRSGGADAAPAAGRILEAYLAGRL